MIRKNNKGLSLVELIVAVAILAVVGVAIMGFVAFSSRNYTQANKNVKLQYEQQMTVNRIRDIVLETSRAIAYDDTTHALTVFSDTSGSSLAMDGVDADANPIIVSRIYFTEAAEGEDAGKLFLLTKTLTSSDIDGKKYSEIAITGTGDELTDTVKEFSADLSDVGNGKVTLHITFKVGEREVEVHPEITLRNKIDVLTDDSELDAIYEKEIIEFTSNVAKVEISRDGKLFGQAKTDTIEMAGDSTTVDYDAVVTKKAYYKGTIDTSVTWELENLKEGYETCIVLDPVTGMLTLKNAGTKKPADYMNGDTFILKAISNEDPTKIARLRIKVGTNGVYPKTINYAETHKQDLLNAQLVYTFTHEIEYTSPIKNSEGTLVNPLTGNDVFTRIKYTVYDADKTTLATIPKGAGFSTTSTDGVFRVVKSMEEKTYNIKVSVLQKDKDGKEVFCWITLYIEKGSVPDGVTEITVPQLYTPDEYKRADYNAASVQWTHGVPFYKEGDTEIPYYYWYEWEIEPVDNWGDSSRNKFDGNVYLYSGGNKGRSYTSYMTERMSLVYVEPRVDWSGTFTMKVSVRAKLSKYGNKIPSRTYKAKSNVKIYKYDAQDNEPIDGYALNSRTQVWTTLAEYEEAKVNGTSLRVNWNYKDGYVNANDIDVSISAKNNSISVYTYSWGGNAMNIANPNIYYRGYARYQNYTVYALVENRNNTSRYKKGYMKEDELNISFYTNKSVTRYSKSGAVNEVILTTGNSDTDIEVLDTTGTKHKIRINGQVGYINPGDYYT
ncbi:MAG: prepilin-type N-terminal cleavage/methylation domain-containing protein, partial [Lachnospiraceae bacterium]|nr:prepilin-type N-terminal cleavage/methylation domain-containing protein [Lachnospiraceae bacterium]